MLKIPISPIQLISWMISLNAFIWPVWLISFNIPVEEIQLWVSIQDWSPYSFHSRFSSRKPKGKILMMTPIVFIWNSWDLFCFFSLEDWWIMHISYDSGTRNLYCFLLDEQHVISGYLTIIWSGKRIS